MQEVIKYAKAELAAQSYDQSWKKPVAVTINANQTLTLLNKNENVSMSRVYP